MKLSLSLLVVPFLSSPWAAGMYCADDNCLRALRNPTRTAEATSFCRTHTAANVTATVTSIPPQFAAQCGSAPTQLARLSSACSCYVPCSPGTTCQAGACTPIPGGNCTSYTASCSSLMTEILASNSIASPQLVDYRIQSALLGLTTPAEFVAALGDNPCSEFTNPDENAKCLQMLASSSFLSRLTDVIKDVLGKFQTCASSFSSNATDYQIIINDNSTCAGHTGARRHLNLKRAGEHLDLTRSMLDMDGISSRDTPPLGPPKPLDLISLSRRQRSTCSRTGDCFSRCPDCRDRETYCGQPANLIGGAVCAVLAKISGQAVGAAAGVACGVLCAELGPGAVACGVVCRNVVKKLVAKGVGSTCNEVREVICDRLTGRCATCNAANGNICDGGNTQCCAGETGTRCGAGCCCCPMCRAPGGPNCACLPAPC